MDTVHASDTAAHKQIKTSQTQTMTYYESLYIQFILQVMNTVFSPVIIHSTYPKPSEATAL